MYNFPKDLYVDVRIEETSSIWMHVQNGEIMSDGDFADHGAMIRVFDGEHWYSCSTNDIGNIQEEIDNLATLATPNPGILENEMVKRFEVHKDSVLTYDGGNDNRKLTRLDYKELIEHYQKTCVDESIPEVKLWVVGAYGSHQRISFFSSKGAKIHWDNQRVSLNVNYQLSCQDTVTWATKYYVKHDLKDLYGHEQEILVERDKMISYMKEAQNIEPGEYTCVFAPVATALFTHESFGHKSESDYMLNDRTLQDEWIIGKKVGNEKISIYDKGDVPNFGYTPYDAEGTRARTNWLIKGGVLKGRLHNAKSAAVLQEDVTGNARAQNYFCQPIVRMTNTFMEPGEDEPEEMIRGVKDGVFVEEISNGTGLANFSIVPTRCYRIRDGKICEPVRVNIIMGNVFETLFDVDAVGKDFTSFETFECGKNGQGVSVGVGGPSIRIKKLKLS